MGEEKWRLTQTHHVRRANQVSDRIDQHLVEDREAEWARSATIETPVSEEGPFPLFQRIVVFI